MEKLFLGERIALMLKDKDLTYCEILEACEILTPNFERKKKPPKPTKRDFDKPDKKEDVPKDKSGGRDTSKLTCFKCKKKGHISRECPQNKNQGQTLGKEVASVEGISGDKLLDVRLDSCAMVSCVDRQVLRRLSHKPCREVARFSWGGTFMEGKYVAFPLKIQGQEMQVQAVPVGRELLDTDVLLSYKDCQRFGYVMDWRSEVDVRSLLEEDHSSPRLSDEETIQAQQGVAEVEENEDSKVFQQPIGALEYSNAFDRALNIFWKRK